ncbi:MAG: hypothetical protein HY699_08760 [Deltaproteobacteria bacterium]|nr:hypothetical protein [Deltaproteobacteria bacterium]
MARTTRIHRKDLKRPDEFVTISAQALAWLRANQRAVGWAAGGIAAAMLASVAFVAVRQARERDANADLGRALVPYRDAKTSADAASQLAEVARRWSSTSAGQVAKLMAASTEIRNDNPDTGIVGLQEALALPSLPGYLKQQALLGYGYALEKKSELGEAASKYAEAAGLDGPYTAQALAAEARARKALGQGDQARAVYERLKKDFPEAAEREQIDDRLGAAANFP